MQHERECVVVAIDPSGASGVEDKRSDEIGIVAARLSNKRYCVLADWTIRGGPQWARAAVHAYPEFKADTIVAETNYGGAMMMHTISAEGGAVSVKIATAARGKVVRAEPISTIYARVEVDHAGTFAELEDQAVNMTIAGGRALA
jgi:phage terminase large subunit-like protein